jgi:anti-sigma factor RsiW
MNANECEQVRMAVMARADGESPAVPPEQVELHLAGCAECRREIEAMQSLSPLLAAQSRRLQTTQLWPRIAPELATAKSAPAEPDSAGFFVVVGLVLLACQAALFFVTPAISPWVKAAAILAIAGLLALRRINPFVIEPELALSKKGSA